MERKLILFGIFVTSLGLSGYWIVNDKIHHSMPVISIAFTDGNSSDNAKERIANLEKDIVTLKKEIWSLKSNLANTSLKLENPQHNLQKITWAEETPEPSPLALAQLKANEDEQNQISEEKIERQFTETENRFREEPIDAKWSEEAETLIHDALQKLNSETSRGLVISQIECRSTQCLLTVEYENEDARLHLESQMAIALSSILPRLNSLSKQHENGIIIGNYILQSDESG